MMQSGGAISVPYRTIMAAFDGIGCGATYALTILL